MVLSLDDDGRRTLVDGIGDPDGLRARSKERRRGLQTVERPTETVGDRLAEAVVAPRRAVVPTGITVGRCPRRGAVIVVALDGDFD
ncbi:MAG: hypothetical protein ACK55I_35495, partial [bacterium]